MSTRKFPKLRGLGWPKQETAVFSTRVSKHVSGREVRAQLYKYPLYEIELSVVGLSAAQSPSYWNFDAQSLQTLQAFFARRGGQFDTFCLKKSDYTGDPCDSQVEGGLLGIGDGTSTSFTFQRFVPSNDPSNPPYQEPIGEVETLGLNVYVNGTLQSTPGNYVTFANGTYPLAPNVVDIYNCSFTGGAPAAGSQITADYTYYWRVRFADDTMQCSNIALYLWENKSIKFTTVKWP